MLKEKEFYVRPESRSVMLRTERIICESYTKSGGNEDLSWRNSDYDED